MKTIAEKMAQFATGEIDDLTTLHGKPWRFQHKVYALTDSVLK